MLQNFEIAAEHQNNNRKWAAGITIMAANTGRILSLRRCGRTHTETTHAGTWCNAGGSPDAGETPLKTALREAVEEITNLQTDTLKAIQPLFYYPADPEKGTSVNFHTFIAVVPEEFIPTLDRTEHSDYAWHEWNEKPHAEAQFHPGIEAMLESHTARMILAKKSRAPWEAAQFKVPSPSSALCYTAA